MRFNETRVAAPAVPAAEEWLSINRLEFAFEQVSFL